MLFAVSYSDTTFDHARARALRVYSGVRRESLKIIFYQYAESGGGGALRIQDTTALLPQSRSNKVTHSGPYPCQ